MSDSNEPRAAASCSWCHRLNAISEPFCLSCGHQARAARADCRCRLCLGIDPPPQVTVQDVDEAITWLKRRAGDE